MSAADSVVIRKVLDLLGLARRAGVLEIGSDQVFASKGRSLFVMSSDVSSNVRKKIAQREAAGGHVLQMRDIDRDALGAAVGASTAQVVAISADHGIAIKIVELLESGVCR